MYFDVHVHVRVCGKSPDCYYTFPWISCPYSSLQNRPGVIDVGETLPTPLAYWTFRLLNISCSAILRYTGRTWNLILSEPKDMRWHDKGHDRSQIIRLKTTAETFSSAFSVAARAGSPTPARAMRDYSTTRSKLAHPGGRRHFYLIV